MLPTVHNIFIVDGNVIIPVITTVFMVETYSMHQFMDDGSHIDAAICIQGQLLHPSNGAHIGPASVERIVELYV